MTDTDDAVRLHAAKRTVSVGKSRIIPRFAYRMIARLDALPRLG